MKTTSHFSALSFARWALFAVATGVFSPGCLRHDSDDPAQDDSDREADSQDSSLTGTTYVDLGDFVTSDADIERWSEIRRGLNARCYTDLMAIQDSFPRLDRNVFSVRSLYEESDEKTFWAQKSPLERLEALEQMRQILYGYDPATTRLQRVLTVAQREPG